VAYEPYDKRARILIVRVSAAVGEIARLNKVSDKMKEPVQLYSNIVPTY
jgi:hypothetical protein